MDSISIFVETDKEGAYLKCDVFDEGVEIDWIFGLERQSELGAEVEWFICASPVCGR
jgi:hypothetical protein